MQVGSFQLPVPRRYQDLSLEVESGKTECCINTQRGVVFNTTRFVWGGFSCTNSQVSCTWRKLMEWNNRNVFSLPKQNTRICRALCDLDATYCSKPVRFTLFETCSARCCITPVILPKPDPMHCRQNDSTEAGA